MSFESKSAFARRLGVDHSHVTRMAQDGRLVVVDGQVEVEASLARIEATRDPNRDDVRQRHAKARDAKRLQAAGGPDGVAAMGLNEGREGVGSGEVEKTAPRAAFGGGDDNGGLSGDGGGSDPAMQAAEVFRKARTAKMHFGSRHTVMRVARLQGRLADMATVRLCAGNDGAGLRSLLENLPDQAAPRVAPVRDAARALEILGELFSDAEAEMAERLTKNIAAMRQGVGAA